MRSSPVGSTPIIRNLAAAAKFAWATSTTPALAGPRQWLTAELPSRFRWVRSAAPGGPTLAYAGIDEGFNHILPFLELQRGGFPVRTGGSVRWRSLVRAVPGAGPDILAVGCTARRARELPAQSSVVLPFRVHLLVSVSPDPEVRLRRVSRKERQAFVRQRARLGWTLEEGATRADFEEFYERFHRPTMLTRHGEATRSLDKTTAYERVFRHGALLYVIENGQRVAGMLCRFGPSAGEITLRLAGVMDGAEKHYRSGVFMSLYILLQEWASDHGLFRMDLSGCEPFLSKGIFQFKRKLHPEVVLPRDHFRAKRLWLRAQRDTPAIRDFLAANPVIAHTPRGLEAVYFHDDRRPPRLDLRWQTPGISGCRLVDLDEFLAGLPTGDTPFMGGTACA